MTNNKKFFKNGYSLQVFRLTFSCFHLKTIRKSKHYYFAQHKNARCHKSNQLRSLPIGSPNPSNCWGERWIERDREGEWRLNGTHPRELERKEKARPRKRFTLREAAFLHLVTITSNAPPKNCPQPLRCQLPGEDLSPLSLYHPQ